MFLLLSALRHFAQGFRVSPCLAYSMVLFSTFGFLLLVSSEFLHKALVCSPFHTDGWPKIFPAR